MDNFWLIGKIHQPLQPRHPLSLGPSITREEAADFFPSLVGKPVLIEHSGPPVGIVTHVWESTRYDKVVLAQLEIHQPAAITAVTSGYLSELSFSQLCSLDPTTGERFGPSLGEEISLVVKGAVENAAIIAWGYGSRIHFSQSGIHKLKMSSEQSKAVEQITLEELQGLREAAAELQAIRANEAKRLSENIEKNIGLISASNAEAFGDVDKQTFIQLMQKACEKDFKYAPVIDTALKAAATASVGFGQMKQKHDTVLGKLEDALKEVERLKALVGQDTGVKESKPVAVSASARTAPADFENNPFFKRLRETTSSFDA